MCTATENLGYNLIVKGMKIGLIRSFHIHDVHQGPVALAVMFGSSKYGHEVAANMLRVSMVGLDTFAIA